MEERVKQTQVESLMTARQVADFLQVSVCTIGRWSRKGALKFYRVGGRGDMRYQLKDVLSFLEESGSHSRADTMGEKVPFAPTQTDFLFSTGRSDMSKKASSREIELAYPPLSH